MQLETNKAYRTRDGRQVIIDNRSDDSTLFYGDIAYPPPARGTRRTCWLADGSTPPDSTGRTEYPTDLIELVATGDSTQATTFHALPVVDVMPHAVAGGIGDVTSEAKGSGARYNTGKPPFELIPLRQIAESYQVMGDLEGEAMHAAIALENLGEFQAGGHVNYLYHAMRELGLYGWDDCATVFDYGRKKYAAWNWSKGMAWSVPIACAARHLLSIIRGEEIDPESGKPHKGHVFCNLVMLAEFVHTYSEGDDRPRAGLLHQQYAEAKVPA